MKMFQKEYIKNLPDCYKKDKTSNNYKLLQIAKDSTDSFRGTLAEIQDSLDLNKVTGKTLDLYGEMVGQSRGLANDEQYRMLIVTRIMRNLSNGSHKSVVGALSLILNCSSSEISLIDTENKSCSVTMSNIDLRVVQAAGMSTSQFTQIVKALLPVGVVVEPFNFDGTFTFSDVDNEYDEETGFSNDEGTIGGYLGVLSQEANDTILPI